MKGDDFVISEFIEEPQKMFLIWQNDHEFKEHQYDTNKKYELEIGNTK